MRVVTLNLWGEQGPLERRWPLVESGLRALDADAVLLQEVRDIPGRLENQAASIARALGMTYAFQAATPWGGGDEGLAIVSRHALSNVHHAVLPHATEHERRIVLGATASTPDGEVGLFTTHLTYRMGDGQKREDQLVVAERVVAAHPARVKVWGGDFNAPPDADEIRWLRGRRSVDGKRVYYQDAWELHHAGEPGITWSAKNPHTKPLAWLEPDRRIDYLFVSHRNRDGSGEVLSSRIALDDGASDHYAVVADVKIATG